MEHCEALRANSEIVPGSESYCLLNELKANVGPAFPYSDEASLRAALEAFYSSSRFAELQSSLSSYESYTGFVVDSSATAERGAGIKAIWMSFSSTMPTVSAAFPHSPRADPANDCPSRYGTRHQFHRGRPHHPACACGI